MKNFTGNSDSLYNLCICDRVYICNGEFLDLFKYFERF